MASLHLVNQQPSLHLAKHPPLANLHSLASVKPLQLAVADRRLASLHNQLKTPDLDSRQQWAVAPLLSGNHLLQDKVVPLDRHHRWDRSLLSDSLHSVKHLNQHLVKHRSRHLARPVLPDKPMPVHSVQRQRSLAVSLKQHNSHRQALDSLQHLVQRQANLVPSPQQQAAKPSNNPVPSQLQHRTTLLSNKQTHSAPHPNLPSANLHNPPHNKTPRSISNQHSRNSTNQSRTQKTRRIK